MAPTGIAALLWKSLYLCARGAAGRDAPLYGRQDACRYGRAGCENGVEYALLYGWRECEALSFCTRRANNGKWVYECGIERGWRAGEWDGKRGLGDGGPTKAD